jgi:hypothetical protein
MPIMKKKQIISSIFLFSLVGTTAYAFPWDIDMVDAIFVRGYEKPMLTPPEGAVSTNNYRPTGFEKLDATEVKEDKAKFGYMLSIPKAKADMPVKDVHSGKETDTQVLQTGEFAFRTYCQTCHGVKGTGKTTFGEGWPLQQNNRFLGIPNIHMVDDTETITSKSRVVLPESDPNALTKK